MTKGAGTPRGGFDRVRSYDVLVIGGGSAGLTAALEIDGLRVAVVTKARFGQGGSSTWAQGGVAAAVGPGDTPALHAEDTLAAGAGLSDPESVAVLTGEGPGRILRLLALGAGFDRTPAGALALGREAAHNRRRILHARGDATGAEIMATLTRAARSQPNLEILEETFVWDLHLERDRTGALRVAGVTALGPAGPDGPERLFLRAPAVILATGGLGRLYRATTNPVEVTGDGLAMAYRAGAELVDLEMVQFHPTALAAPGADPLPLLTEALRGEGAILVDGAGERFMVAEHPDAELAPRDVVARAIHRRLEAGVPVYLDARDAVGERFPDRFPTVFELAGRHGLDPRTDLLPVSPAAHYHMGGIATDDHGRTSLPGLWACGEAASTGIHGANRLASNSLLESLVFGARVAADVVAAHPGPVRLAAEPTPPPAGAGRLPAGPAGEQALDALRRLAWEHLGLVRTEAGLAAAQETLDRWARDEERLAALGGEGRNLLLAARLVAAAARRRTESRGGHYRLDHPETDPAWRRRLAVRRGGEAGDLAPRIVALEPLEPLEPLVPVEPLEAAAAVTTPPERSGR